MNWKRATVILCALPLIAIGAFILTGIIVGLVRDLVVHWRYALITAFIAWAIVGAFVADSLIKQGWWKR